MTLAHFNCLHLIIVNICINKNVKFQPLQYMVAQGGADMVEKLLLCLNVLLGLYFICRGVFIKRSKNCKLEMVSN